MSSPTPSRAAAASSYRRRGRCTIRRARVRRCRMKLMYFLMDKEEKHRKRAELELEVSELEAALDKETRLGRILHCSLQGRVVCHCCLSTLVPNKVIDWLVVVVISLCSSEFSWVLRIVIFAGSLEMICSYFSWNFKEVTVLQIIFTVSDEVPELH